MKLTGTAGMGEGFILMAKRTRTKGKRSRSHGNDARQHGTETKPTLLRSLINSCVRWIVQSGNAVRLWSLSHSTSTHQERRPDDRDCTQTTVTELTPEEIETLLKNKTYARVRPSHCEKCDYTESFFRRIFRVTGIPNAEQFEETTQESLRHRFSERENINWTHFLIFGGNIYADSATCPRCNSTTIAYGIVIDDESISHMAKIAGVKPHEIEARIDALAETGSKKEGDR